MNTQTGYISGNAAATGFYPVTLTAANASGTASAILPITIQKAYTSTATAKPVITSPATAAGYLGQSFSYAASGASISSFSALGLPPGLSIDHYGSISGKPAQVGTYSVTLLAVA